MRAAAKTTAVVVLLVVGMLTGALPKAWQAATDAVTAAQGSPLLGGTSAASGTPDDPSSYAYSATTDTGQPVMWNACSPIPVIVNLAGAPDGALDDLLAAIDQVNQASGLQLAYQGTTELALSSNWNAGPAAGYAGWPPVLIGWAAPSTGLLDSDNGGRTYTWHTGQAYVTAMVVFNSELDANRPAGFGAPGTRGALYLHELSHVAGLGHVEDHGQLMHPSSAFGAELGAGDRAGLATLGTSCVPAPAAAW